MLCFSCVFCILWASPALGFVLCVFKRENERRLPLDSKERDSLKFRETVSKERSEISPQGGSSSVVVATKGHKNERNDFQSPEHRKESKETKTKQR